MGEVNPEAWKVLTRALGEEPRYVFHQNGTTSLHLGNVILTAQAGLRGDPSVYGGEILHVSWAGQHVSIPATPPTQRQGEQ